MCVCVCVDSDVNSCVLILTICSCTHLYTEHHPPDEKVSYAKRMAQGYLRSVGMAEYTPKTSGYTKQSQADESHAKQTWKKVDDDFDFSEPKPNPERKISNEAPRPTDGGKVTQFSHAKENQAKRTMGQSVHKFDDEGIGETPSKSSDVVKPSNETKVVETATVTWKNVDYNFDFGEIKASPLTDKKDTSEIARPNEDNGAQGTLCYILSCIFTYIRTSVSVLLIIV